MGTHSAAISDCVVVISGSRKADQMAARKRRLSPTILRGLDRLRPLPIDVSKEAFGSVVAAPPAAGRAKIQKGPLENLPLFTRPLATLSFQR